tara:strand:- start:5784 stop:6482 length:699 start_codon:yes stop_codon:yes gene_type:complete
MAETESIDGLSQNEEEEIDDAIDNITSDEEGEQENDELDEEQSVNESDDDESVIEKDKLPEIDEEIKLPDLLSGSDSNFIFDDDDDDDDVEAADSDTETADEEEDELYLEKIDFNLKESFLTNYHPEKLYHNYDEVYNLSKVVRNKNNEIIDELHKTIPFLTKYEKAKLLGMRANQINNGGKPFIKLDSNIIDGYVIAQMELQQKKIPFIIRRPMPNGGCEYWKVSDLEIFE